MSKNHSNGTSQIALSIDLERLSTRILFIFIAVEILLVALDYQVNYGKLSPFEELQDLFNFAREDGLGSWLSSAQTLLVGLCFGILYLCTRNQSKNNLPSTGWLMLTLFFVYMAIDDGAQLHERFAAVLYIRAEQSGESLSFFPSYPWQLLFLPIYVTLGILSFYFLWTQIEDKAYRKLLLVSASSFAVAIGLDFIEGLEKEHAWNIYTWLGDHTDLDYWAINRFQENGYDTLLHFSRTIEEALEMFAHTLLWFVVLRHIANTPRSIRIDLSNPGNKNVPRST